MNDEDRKTDWVPPDERVTTHGKLEPAELDFLETLGSIGGGLMMMSLPQTAMMQLMNHGYVELDKESMTAQTVRVRLTPAGMEMVETRKRIRSERA